ncbi:MAG: hypothetical protein SFY67_15875 [Candidatus Melainabacteria bacterium]|nr:hypothetical protein [Candidatus Melainabacteria bacterium]
MAQKKTAQQRGMKRAQKVLARAQRTEKVRKTRVLAKLDHAHGENSDHKN